MISFSFLVTLLAVAVVTAFVPSRFSSKTSAATKLNERFTKFEIESDPLIFSEVPLRENFMQNDYRLSIGDFLGLLFKKGGEEEAVPAPAPAPAPAKKASPVKKISFSAFAKPEVKSAPVAKVTKAAAPAKPVAAKPVVAKEIKAAPSKPAAAPKLAPTNPQNGQRKTVKIGKN